MKAVALLKEGSTLQIIETPTPVLEGPRQVLVRVLQVGVCGTDRAIVRGEEGEAPPGAQHLVLGHEMVGRVEEVGSAVRGVRLGELVVATVRRGCGECESCLHGESDVCYTGRFRERGIVGEHGFMTPYIREEEEYLVPLPPSLERVGVLVEPLTTGEKALEAVRRVQARLRPRCGHPGHAWNQEEWGGCKQALVVGAGAIGVMAAFLLRVHGVDTTVMATQPSNSPKGALVREMGARYLSTSEVAFEVLSSALPDLVLIIEATGAGQVPLQLAPHLGRNGALALLGVPEGSRDVTVDAATLVRELVLGNRVILGSVNSNIRHFRMAVQHLAQIQERFPEALQQVIDRTYPLEQFEEAFFNPPRGVIKVTLAP